MAKLSSEDRQFFALVAQAAFANPFSELRAGVDLSLAQAKPSDSREDVLEVMIQNVWKRLSRLGPLQLENWEGEDRAMLELALLFSEFHKYSPQMDVHIQRQLRSQKPLKAGFGQEIYRGLCGAQMDEERALRAVGFFYQMRRAFFFISTSLVGDSAPMCRVREQLWNNVFTHDLTVYESRLWNRMEDFSTFLVGDTGTGKGMAGAAIGRSGWTPYDLTNLRFEQSFTTAFVSVNVSEFSENLIEIELFGHRKGAFTGAIDTHVGVFQRCEPHGTIFLDEIGDVSTQIQVKLLRVLQDRKFSPVGSHDSQRFEGRVIAATNRPIDELRSQGAFRDDFFYRLCSDVITMPTLRERVQSSPTALVALIEHLSVRITGSDALTDHVMEVIDRSIPEHYEWPGNVRELEQRIRRIVLTGECSVVPVSHAEGTLESIAVQMDAAGLTARALTSEYCRLLYARFGTYEEVARITELDRRTVRKYVVEGG